MSEVAQPQPTRGIGHHIGSILGGILLIILIALLARWLLVDYGIIAPAMQPAATARALPTTEARPTYPPAPTSPPVAPSALPVGQPVAPAVQVDPAAPQPAPVVGPNPEAPATIKTRAPVCFGGWWYIEGQSTGISCSGTGGD
jgi:hypothetical protein